MDGVDGVDGGLWGEDRTDLADWTDWVSGVLTGRGVLDWVYLGCYPRLVYVVPLGQVDEGEEALAGGGEVG